MPPKLWTLYFYSLLREPLLFRTVVRTARRQWYLTVKCADKDDDNDIYYINN